MQRVECESDKRGAWAALTDKGAATLADAGPGHVAAVRATMFDVLSPDDITVMADAFTTMRDHMQERRSTT